MYAVTIAEPGGPEVLTWSQVPDPSPGPGEVLIDIHASGVNRPDRRLPMDQAAEAHRIIESSAHFGKILLIPPGTPD